MMRWILCLICLSAAKLLSAQDVYQIDAQYPVHALDNHLQIYPDPDGRLGVNDIINDSSLNYLTRDALPRHLDPRKVYWGKIKVVTDDSLIGWTLHLEDKYFKDMAWIRGNGKVDVYAFNEDQSLFHKRSGGNYPQSQREIPIPYNQNSINLELPAGQTVTLYIRIESIIGGIPPFFNLSLRAPEYEFYHPYINYHIFFRSFLFGICFITLLYHLLQYIYLRESIFLWFCLWLGVCTLTQALANDYTSDFLTGDFWKHRFTVWTAVSNCILFTFWFFGRSFINSKDKFPALDKIILVYTWALGAEIIVTVLSVISHPEKIYFGIIGHHYQWIIGSSILGLGLAIYIASRKDPFARYFGFGAIIATVAALLGGLWSERLIRLPFEPYSWGILLQIIAYSFGIAYRRQQMMKEAVAEKLAAQEAQSEIQRIMDLDEIKTRFFANISHEFRTPLSLIMGPINNAREAQPAVGSSKDAPVVLKPEAFAMIRRNARRLQNLVDQLLDLSKAEGGHMQLKLTRGDLIRFIRSVVFSFQSLAERQNISLNTSFPKELDEACYDKDKLEKILTNLLSNAFKYTPSGGAVTVTVQFDEEYYSIEVSDTGSGVGKSDLKRIFERFYRVEGSEKKGSGIGLALTKELVDLHNGQISVSSVLGEGTTFKTRLPYTLKGLPESAVSAFGETLEKIETPGEIPLMKNQEQVVNKAVMQTDDLPVVLVVEDNDDLRSFIEEILRDHYKVLAAVDGMQGERMAFEHIPDIIISDVMMPKKDGYALCQSLKTNPKTSHIPVILLTAKAGQENKIEGLTQGADVYMTKPFDAKELRLHMHNLVDARLKLWSRFMASDMAVVPDLDMSSLDDQFLQSVIQAIKENLDNELLSVEDLARTVGFSRSQLHRKLKALTNKSANQMITEIRLNEARRMLEKRAGTVSEIAYSVGYTNMSYFTKSFKERFGVLPSKV